MHSPQYRVICPTCGNSEILNRGETRTTGMLWWKQTRPVAEVGNAKCWKCNKNFDYDINNSINCYSTAMGISPQEAFVFNK